MKNIGKPCTGKLYARFDEGGLAIVTTVRLLRHRRTKVAETDRPRLRLRDACSLLYLILFPKLSSDWQERIALKLIDTDHLKEEDVSYISDKIKNWDQVEGDNYLYNGRDAEDILAEHDRDDSVSNAESKHEPNE